MQTCPKCGSKNSRRSSRRIEKRKLKHHFSTLYRCRDCSARFLRFDPALTATRFGLPLVGAAGLLLVVWLAASPEEHAAVPLRPVAGEPPPMVPGLLLTDDSVQAAAEAGDPEAQYRLALDLLARFREQGDRDALQIGIRWVQSAADQGHARAQLVLGTQYLEGRGVIQDYAAAARWYREAATQGDSEAMFYLGQMTETGKGVELDLLQAYVWLNLAAARGETRAEMARERVRGNLTPAEVARAQDRARDLEETIPRPLPPAEHSPAALGN